MVIGIVRFGQQAGRATSDGGLRRLLVPAARFWNNTTHGREPLAPDCPRLKVCWMIDAHDAAIERIFDPEPIARRNARYGWTLFVAYLALYGLFVGLNTFWPQVMDLVPAAGVNLAIWFGVGLIVAALVLAVIYAWLCRSAASPARSTRPGA
jgi:uncharacterized membrane protein (DUF485 family)